VVQQVRRVVRQKKVGHCGTLDPAATGLLVLTLGKATRLTRFLIRAPKVYEGQIRLGVTTDTYDAQGEVVQEREVPAIDDEVLHREMGAFVGRFDQTTPPFSAKKLQGVRFYTLARRGEEVPVSKKEIEVFEFEILGRPADELLDFRLACSSGTYVRSLAHDLGEKLGCGAHLASLRRVQVGPFEIADSLQVGRIEQKLADESTLEPAWIPLDEVPLPFAEIVADSQQEARALHGQTVVLRNLSCEEGDWVKMMNNRRQMLAIGTVTEQLAGSKVGVVQPKIVFR
jgi:tRNA pseudouridine55 synthase